MQCVFIAVFWNLSFVDFIKSFISLAKSVRKNFILCYANVNLFFRFFSVTLPFCLNVKCHQVCALNVWSAAGKTTWESDIVWRWSLAGGSRSLGMVLWRWQLIPNPTYVLSVTRWVASLSSVCHDAPLYQGPRINRTKTYGLKSLRPSPNNLLCVVLWYFDHSLMVNPAYQLEQIWGSTKR